MQVSSHDDNGVSRLMTASIALLARREHSRAELEARLARRCDDHQLIQKTIERLQEQGLQSDERFCEQFVRYRIGQGKGPFVIRSDLRQKGLSDELITKHLNFDDAYWSEQSERVYQKKFGSRSVGDDRDRAKRLRFMVSRGFPAHLVYPLIELS
jgi:regulatory protein